MRLVRFSCHSNLLDDLTGVVVTIISAMGEEAAIAVKEAPK